MKDLAVLAVPCACYYALMFYSEPVCTDPRRFSVPEEFVVVNVEGVHFTPIIFITLQTIILCGHFII